MSNDEGIILFWRGHNKLINSENQLSNMKWIAIKQWVVPK